MSELQQGIIEAVAEYWQYRIEEREEGDEVKNSNLAEQLKAWYDNQLDDLHDAAGDTEYQGQVIRDLREFRNMIQRIKEMDFGLEDLEEAISRESE